MAVSAVAPVVAQAAEVETLETLNEKRTTAIDTAKATINEVVVNIEKVGAEIKAGIGDSTLDTAVGKIATGLDKDNKIKLDSNVDYGKLSTAMQGLEGAKTAIENTTDNIESKLNAKVTGKAGTEAQATQALNTIQAIKDGIVKAEKEVRAVKDLDDAIKAKEDEKLKLDKADAKAKLKKALAIYEIANKVNSGDRTLGEKYNAVDKIVTDDTIEGATKDNLKANFTDKIDELIDAANKVIVDNGIDVALAEGKEVEVKEYKDIFKTNGTLETKDDKLALADGEEVLYAEGTIGTTLADTNAKYVIAKKKDTKDLNEAQKEELEAKIKAEATKYSDFKANLKELEAATFTKNGKTKKVYNKTVSKAEIDKNTTFLTENGDIQVITLTRNDEADAKFAQTYTFILRNVKMDDVLVNENDKVASLPKFKTVLTDEKLNNDKIGAIKKVIDGKDVKLENDVVTVDFVGKTPVASLSRILEVVDTTYAGKDVEIKETEAYVDGHLNKTITYTEKGKKEELGKIVIKGYDEFKKNSESKFVRISSIKDLNSLKLPEISYAKEAVMNALYNGQLSGNEKHELNLKSDITRAEFAKLLVEMKGLTKAQNKQPKDFKDVAKDAWYHDYVDVLSSNDIVKGDGDGTFRPEDTITRQEVAVMIAQAIHKGEVDKYNEITGEPIDTKTSFLDDDDIAMWADASVLALKESGITNGYKVKNHFEFRPENQITRAEALVMLDRASNGYTKDGVQKTADQIKADVDRIATNNR